MSVTIPFKSEINLSTTTLRLYIFCIAKCLVVIYKNFTRKQKYTPINIEKHQVGFTFTHHHVLCSSDIIKYMCVCVCACMREQITLYFISRFIKQSGPPVFVSMFLKETSEMCTSGMLKLLACVYAYNLYNINIIYLNGQMQLKYSA